MSIVREVHEATGQDAPQSPPLKHDPDMIRLRIRLIREETKEVVAELSALLYDPAAKTAEGTIDIYRRLLKELADLRYVTEGTAVALGLPIDCAYAAVHASNMSKIPSDGLIRKDEGGKVLKPDSYRPADMTEFVPNIVDIEEHSHG
jgi:predicted HAD superfamily Cof-like phosphohydrolase